MHESMYVYEVTLDTPQGPQVFAARYDHPVGQMGAYAPAEAEAEGWCAEHGVPFNPDALGYDWHTEGGLR